MSSSSSSYSDEDTEASAPGVTAPPSASQLGQVVELAQICSFCATFRKPLRLPSFSRSELQDALLGASNGDRTHVELLAELHFKLAREHPTAKMEKMVQDWEKTLARKLQENWRKEFTANPMGGGVLYRDLTVFERVKILDALCHWKLDTCAEIHKHIATLQKENDNDGIRKLRAGEVGTDDKGVSYWYFDDGCWIYAEDKPRWQREERKPSYLVEFASAKRIRLSINFDPDNNSSAPPVRLPVKAYEVHEEVKEEKKVKMEGASEIVKQESKLKDEVPTSESTKNEGRDAVKAEQHDATAVISKASSDETLANVKEEASTITAGRMDSDILCAVGSHSTGTEKRGELAVTPSQTNGTAQVKDATDRSTDEVNTSLKLDEGSSAASHKEDSEGTTTNTEDTTTSTEVNEDNSVDHSHASVVAIVGSKKRTIIDDDSSDSSSDTDAKKAAARKEVDDEVSSPPPRKKRKASVEHSNSEPSVNDETSKNDVIKSDNTAANGIAAPAEVEPAVAVAKETGPASKPEKGNEGGLIDDVQASKTAVEKTVETAKPLGPAATSPTDPAAAPESFDITCESCKKCYDMRYVDPPLVERPTDEWRCFECLVNDARGWPRRRKSKPREPFSPRADGRGGEEASKKRNSSSKARTGSSSSKKSKKSSSKSSSSKKKSSRSSSSKRKSSSSKSSSSKKSSSSSKRHKKRKSSSSSHHHHSSSHSHHRRRHHSHYHHEEFAKLVGLFRDRQERRLGIEEARIKGDLQVACDEAPQGWRVVSSTLDDLRALIETLSGGSLEQDRLRGRLILILKDQEKLDEQRRKQQELAWNILPRRQSSRIAIGRMRQSAQDSDAEVGVSDDDVESRRPGLRSSRSHSTTSDFDDKQKLAYDRASRARRRHQDSDDEMDEEDDEVDGNAPTPGNWIDWSLLKGNTRRLSTVCLALVNRLLKEEAADLFSRPVNPELDGCPNYLSVINHPMDLGTIRSRLESNSYRKWEIFKKDVDLVWQNCRTFNAPDTMVVQFADLLSRLSRSMCVAAEKKGVSHMKDIANGDGNSADEDGNYSDASKAESRSSINKAWTESSASESSESSDGDSSSGGDSGSDSRKRRPTRSSSKKPQTRSRSTRSSRTRSPAKSRPSRSTRSRSSKKRPAPSSSSEDESSASEDEVLSPVRKSRRQPRSSSSKASAKVDPPTEDDSSGDESASNRPPPPQNGAPSPSPPPPPPPQALVQKRSKPRLIISDSSSSDDSSDSNSSSSSSSDSDDSDSDVPATSKGPQPPSPSSAEVPAPPPPSPPPPAASPVDSKPRSSPKVNTKPKTSASHGRKAKAPSAAKTHAGGSGYAHSGPLLNTYLSPSSSSSSDLSSGSSDSSDGDSDDSD